MLTGQSLMRADMYMLAYLVQSRFVLIHLAYHNLS